MHRFIVAILLLAAPHGVFASPGALFAEPDFFTLGPGIGLGFDDTGVLGDVDGDGDLDLVVGWTRWLLYADDGASGEHEHLPHWGWTVASNDGLGGLVPTRDVMDGRREVGSSTPIIHIWGDDFDGDGLLDLAFAEGLNLELWHNRGEDGFTTILRLPNTGFVGLADGEGDGDVDLLVMEYDDESLENHEGTSQATLWFNDGDAAFVRSDQFTLDSEERLWPRLWPAERWLGAGGAVRLLWYRTCYQQLREAGPTVGWLTQPWAASAEPPLFLKSMVNPCYSTPLQAGRDGQMDLVSIAEVTVSSHTNHGLVLWRLDASGVEAHHTLLGSQVHVQGHPLVSDLNGDGLQDVALVDGNEETGPALVVLIGQSDGVPVLEGRYRLPGTGGTGNEVLAGDLNGDGAADLVVLGRNEDGGTLGAWGVPGGAFVFINQGSPPTAVAVESATPSAFVLGANYPNPFNPATTIPLSVPDGAEAVDVAIYNLLGQLVRQVWSGPLAAGEHRLTWDGRDGQGQLVASGAYLYQVRVGEQLRTRKMVKLE
ncbi:MAG: FG-GAP-like repeat-containing protein [Gemmatimonadota bacterium]|nr:FG-GAP-like repeat-containing protein [Gemmatimonadota bacterium]